MARTGYRICICIALAALGAAADSASAQCREIWVDQAVGVNSPNTEGTSDDPFKSITYALAVAENQGWPEPWCVYIRPGSYDADPAKPASEREAFPIELGPGMVFEGTDRDTCIIDGQHLPAGSAALLYGNDLLDLEIRGLTLRNMNRSAGNGGAIELINCSGLLEDCAIDNCRAATGGGMSLHPRSVADEGFDFVSCVFAGNTATAGNRGGGLAINGSVVGNVTDSTFSNNTATNSAGGGFGVSGSFTGNITRCTLIGNTSGGDSGAGFEIRGTLTGDIEECTFTDNVLPGPWSANRVGGAAFCVHGSLNGNVRACSFTGNATVSSWSALAGGFRIVNTLNGDITDCILVGNYVQAGTWYPGTYAYGGGFRIATHTGQIAGCLFKDNSASSADSYNAFGGGFYVDTLGNGISSCTFTGNYAKGNGGGFYVNGGLSGGISRCEFRENQSGPAGAGYSGAAFYANANVNGDISDCVFQDNRDEYAGIHVVGALTGDVRNCSFLNDQRQLGDRALLINGTFSGILESCRFFGFPYCDVEFASNSATLAMVRDCLFVEPGQPLGTGTWAISTRQKMIAHNNTMIGPGLDTTISPAALHFVFGTPAESGEIYNNIITNTKWGIRVGPTVDLPIQYNHFADVDCIVVQDQSCLGNDISFIELLLDNFRHNYYEDPLLVDWPTGAWTDPPVYDPNTAQTTFVDSGAAWGANELVGLLLKPDQPNPFRALITANTGTTITVWGDCDEYGTPGNVYEIMDYHLSSASPCVDTGDPDFVGGPTETDVDGAVRVWDGDGDGEARVDRGAHEYGAPLLVPGDVDGDGDVDLTDLALLLSAYGTSSGDPDYNPNADLDNDGDVDLTDLAALLAVYGTACE